MLVLAACGGGDDGDVGDATALDAPATEVTIELVAFEPAEIQVSAGETVAWSNEDPGAHTVTSGEVEQGTSSVSEVPDGRFASGEIANGESFEHVFDEPGTYPYFCELHPATMRGVVEVS